MNILHLVPALEAGGVETGTIDLANSLKKLGQNVFVISNGGRLVKDLEENGIFHLKLPIHRKNPLSLLYVDKVASFIKTLKIDVVHASSRIPAWIGLLASRKTKTPFVTSCHGFYSKHFFSSVMAKGKLVMVISKTVEERMVEDFKVPKERIRLVYRGVDLSKYPYDPNKYDKDKKSFKIINIGRLTPIKGQYEFIKAIRLVLDKIKDIEVSIVGGAQRGKEDYSIKLMRLAKE